MRGGKEVLRAMTDMTVSREIAKQIGNRAFVMMGAKNLVGGDDHLSFRLGGGANKRATHVTVTLMPDDTYMVELIRCNVRERKVLATCVGIYAENLNRTISGLTGFYLSL